ncbi:MAG: monovalent cation/H+ antiporter subunit D [Cereibacter sphaeroides]|uniref:Monovalent cation/H+ antiporter subunit D n=1 Tax=Cereibacter sphaeroides TaxID=1063 RepID=A0A2W5S147_CERSP|nr:MAG: monovalent cation/H+ antiporter subunit D [Cereibacter sphaeroides]
MSHWIIVPVVLPAIVAALMVLAMRNDILLQRIFGLGATLALGAVAAMLLHAASFGPPEAYFLGDWPAPFGIVLMLDRLSAQMLVLTAVLAFFVQLYVVGTDWDRRGRHFHALFMFQMMGLNGAFLTGDLFNLFVFFEVLLIASYGLMIHGGGRDRLRAGLQYVAFNLLGSTLFLFALATLYSVTGTLNMADLAEKAMLLPEGDAGLFRVAAVFLFLVFAIKGALVPLHFWLPGTYANAPGPVAALFAIMTKVGAYAMIRVFAGILPPEVPAIGPMIADILLPAALVTMAVGAIGVLGARGLARLVSFAAIGSIGTLFTGISLFTQQSITAALYYLVHSTLATAALFLLTDMILRARGDDTVREARAPIPRNGLTAALFFVAAIAIAGLPPLSGFLGKLLILDAARFDMMTVWPAVLITSLLTIIGLATAGSTLFWKAAGEPENPVEAAGPLPFVAIGGLIACMVALTLFAGPLTGYLSQTAGTILDPGSYIGANYLADQD